MQGWASDPTWACSLYLLSDFGPDCHRDELGELEGTGHPGRPWHSGGAVYGS